MLKAKSDQFKFIGLTREEYKNINDILKFVIESRHDEENSK